MLELLAEIWSEPHPRDKSCPEADGEKARRKERRRRRKSDGEQGGKGKGERDIKSYINI
jgi:hypothetical protein